ncbi:MAG: NTP transferase domain-containing protein, partial [Thermodesulfobacteria bacterium]|nr:NTP transferase domain-containing protein [Thermodesulfobacteriota bacterium]
GKDPLVKSTGAPCKALVPVGGVPMIRRVVEALLASPTVEEVFLCGPEEKHWQELRPLLPPSVKWIAPASTPSRSTLKALELLGETPVFLTTGDHALLTPEVVEYFLHRAPRTEGADLVVGVARYETLRAAYPDARRTTYRLKEGRFCSTNLYAFLTPAAKQAVYFWRRVEEKRKNPLAIVRAFGARALAKYLSGRLSLEEAFARVSRVLGCRVAPVVIPHPEAAIDVDDPEDLALANQILTKRGEKEP